jgi:hypothetical protein
MKKKKKDKLVKSLVKENRAKAKRIEKLAARAVEIEIATTALKQLYRELDDITMELIEMGISSALVGGYQITIADNFAEKNTAFRIARIKRFDLKVDKIDGLSFAEVAKKKKSASKTEVFKIRSRRKQ